MSLSDFRRVLGYSNRQFDDETAASRSILLANASHDPAKSAHVNEPRARLESRMTPEKPKRYYVVPHLLSLATFFQRKVHSSIYQTLGSDHSDGFTVYKTAFTGKWSLLHALVAALTIRHPSFKFSVLDLYYYYKKAVEHGPINQASTAGFLAPVNPAAYDCMFDWDITAQAIDYYMKDLGFPPHAFVVIQPVDDKTTPSSRIFTSPRSSTDQTVAGLQRMWLIYTENRDPHRAQCNVVIKYNTELSPSFVHAVNELESQRTGTILAKFDCWRLT